MRRIFASKHTLTLKRILCLAVFCLVSACAAALAPTSLPTPISAEYMPTVIQETLQAQGVGFDQPRACTARACHMPRWRSRRDECQFPRGPLPSYFPRPPPRHRPGRERPKPSHPLPSLLRPTPYVSAGDAHPSSAVSGRACPDLPDRRAFAGHLSDPGDHPADLSPG